MMYQKCPICEGKGTQEEKPCSTCNGTKIISSLTGLPPFSPFEEAQLYREHLGIKDESGYILEKVPSKFFYRTISISI